MALYKETGANPAAGCLPLLLQMPILISLYQAVLKDSKMFATQTWLWIGSKVAIGSPLIPHKPIPHHAPLHLLAPSLADPDFVLLALYIVSMYLSIRFTSPAIDPAQAQQQKMMAFISPAMIGYIGYQYAWPSALILYWLAFNVFTTAQQLYLINRYHRNPAGIGPHPEAEPAGGGAMATTVAAIGSANAGATSSAANGASKSGSRSARRRRSRR
jgi:YidC/Oxa1 family membrane protein insertase